PAAWPRHLRHPRPAPPDRAVRHRAADLVARDGRVGGDQLPLRRTPEPRVGTEPLTTCRWSTSVRYRRATVEPVAVEPAAVEPVGGELAGGRKRAPRRTTAFGRTSPARRQRSGDRNRDDGPHPHGRCRAHPARTRGDLPFRIPAAAVTTGTSPAPHPGRTATGTPPREPTGTAAREPTAASPGSRTSFRSRSSCPSRHRPGTAS